MTHTTPSRKQRAVIHIEGLSPPEQKPWSGTTSPSEREDAAVSAGKTTVGRRPRRWLRIFLRGAVTVLAIGFIIWALSWLRFEVIPVPSSQPGFVQYIVKDRWTGEIEVVWQHSDGRVWRSHRQAFE